MSKLSELDEILESEDATEEEKEAAREKIHRMLCPGLKEMVPDRAERALMLHLLGRSEEAFSTLGFYPPEGSAQTASRFQWLAGLRLRVARAIAPGADRSDKQFFSSPAKLEAAYDSMQRQIAIALQAPEPHRSASASSAQPLERRRPRSPSEPAQSSHEAEQQCFQIPFEAERYQTFHLPRFER